MMLSPHKLSQVLLLSLLVVAPRLVAAQGAPAPAATGDSLRISLDEAVALAVREGDEVGIAMAQRDIADAQFGAARANLLPQLRVSGSYQHVYESARGQAVGSVFNQPNTYTGNLNLSQTIFQGGRLVSAARAANDLREASRYDATERIALVSLQVQRSYLQALFAERIAELQERNMTLASSRVTQVEQFERAGRAARYDVLRARVERANIEPLAIQARNDRVLALLELKRLLNLPVERPLALATRIGPHAATAVLASVDDAAAAPDRATVRSAERIVSARRFGVAVARADYWPTISAFAQSGYQAFPLSGLPRANGALTEGACPAGSTPGRLCQNGGWFSDRLAGLSISMPVFDGFRVKSNVDIAKAQLRLADLQLRQEREAVSVEVARTRAELHRSRALYSARQQNSIEAEEAFRLATLRFARGLSTQLEVSDAQLALLTAQSTEARATYDLFLASADLARSLGRPIPTPTAAPLPSSPR